MDFRLPLTILSGFLGSGKTTLLARLLGQEQMSGTAVLVNDFGEIGLDHLLLEGAGSEAQVVAGGCICCTSQGELQVTLRRLLRESARQGGARLRRVVIESSGLSDPGGIIASIYGDPALAARFAPAVVVTAVDACLGALGLDEHEEARRQAGAADRLLLTKLDIAEPGQAERLRHRLRHLNSHADLLDAREAGPGALFDLPDVVPAPMAEAGCGCAHASHTHAFESHCFLFAQPLEWEVLSNWLGSVAFFHGAQVLRLKGLVFVEDEPVPYAIHGIRNLVHEPAPLPSARPSDGVSRIVFITTGLDRSTLEAALERARPALLTP